MSESRSAPESRVSVEERLLLGGVRDALPETWHAGKALDVRVRLLVDAWANCVRVSSDLERQRNLCRDYVASLHGAENYEQLTEIQANLDG